MEAAQTRVQDAVTKMVDDLDRQYIRKMQKTMYLCSAKCCENDSHSIDDVQRCIETCSLPLNQAQNSFQGELQNFQNRLQRCAMDCQDRIRDKVPSDAKSDIVSRYRGELEDCVVKCADSHVALIPSLMQRMKEVLKKHS